MKLKDNINIKKALIVFPIVIVMVGGTLAGAFSTLFLSDSVPKEKESVESKNLEDVIKDENALKIIDIHENLDKYIDKEVTLEGFFLDYDKDSKMFSVEVPIEDGEVTVVSLSVELENTKLLDKITDTDLVKATGVIGSFEDSHPEDEAEETEPDHTHTTPIFVVKKVELIR